MTNPPNIDAIIAELSEATGADRKIDGDIACAIGLLHPRDFITPTCSVPQSPAYTASLDAAMTLAGDEAVGVLLDAINNCREQSVADWMKALPRHICIAALRVRSALIGEVGRDG